MKVDKIHVILAAALLILVWFQCSGEDPVDPEPITITIDGSEGTTGVVDLQPEVKTDTVYNTLYETEIVVDREYRELYEKTNDSLKRLNLYLKAIQINEYSDTIVDNDEITIKAFTKVRGELLQYKADYHIKPKEFTYTPEVITRFPAFSVGVGVEAGVPLMVDESFALKANLEFMNRKGNSLTFSYDTDKRVWVGIKKTFKLKK